MNNVKAFTLQNEMLNYAVSESFKAMGRGFTKRSIDSERLGRLPNPYDDAYDTHDCTLSPEDGCKECDKRFEETMSEKGVHPDYWMDKREDMVENDTDDSIMEKYL